MGFLVISNRKGRAGGPRAGSFLEAKWRKFAGAGSEPQGDIIYGSKHRATAGAGLGPRDVVVEVLDEVNRTDELDEELRPRVSAGIKRAAKDRRELGEITKRQAALIKASADAMLFWTSSKRHEVAQLFHRIARHDGLSAELRRIQKEKALAGLSYGVDPGPSDSPLPMAVPQFNSLDSMIAYAALWIAQQGSEGPRVVECAHCGKLVLAERGGRRGRPRTRFCSAAHSNLHGQVQFQKRLARKKAAAARKRK